MPPRRKQTAAVTSTLGDQAMSTSSSSELEADELRVFKNARGGKGPHLKADPPHVLAPKTIAVWKSLVARICDRNQTHIRSVLKSLIPPGANIQQERRSMLQALADRPPVVALFQYSPGARTISAFDPAYPDNIFLCSKLSQALEQAENGSRVETLLEFLVFNAMLHELGHWLLRQPDPQRTSVDVPPYKDYTGKSVGECKDQGEGGYLLEGGTWGGVVCWGFPVDKKGEIQPGLFRISQTRQDFDQVRVVTLRRGLARDPARDEIDLDAIWERLAASSMIEEFLSQELNEMHRNENLIKSTLELTDTGGSEEETNVEQKGKGVKRRKDAKSTKEGAGKRPRH